ncbi:MAG: hypothetical protein FD170_1973 [Bacteroidetes bacterium]|nr:MAG: hypothetical protein FD170_1973 [Bacteroidota bacterium]
MIEKRTMNQIIEATILNVASTKPNRKATVQTVLNEIPKIRLGLKLEGTNLIVDTFYGIEAETDFQNKLQEVINTHSTTHEKDGNGHRILIVDLLKPRV